MGTVAPRCEARGALLVAGLALLPLFEVFLALRVPALLGRMAASSAEYTRT
jgi:hypothetical protein